MIMLLAFFAVAVLDAPDLLRLIYRLIGREARDG